MRAHPFLVPVNVYKDYRFVVVTKPVRWLKLSEIGYSNVFAQLFISQSLTGLAATQTRACHIASASVERHTIFFDNSYISDLSLDEITRLT